MRLDSSASRRASESSRSPGSSAARHTRRVIVTCMCCGRWRVERVQRDETHASDRQRGGRPAGERVIWRLHHLRDDGIWVRWRDFDDADDLAAELMRKRVQLPL